MGQKALAAVHTAPGKCEMREITLPEMTDDDVLIKTQLSAISTGTERWCITGKRPDVRFPTVVGYLNCGTAVAVGKNVTHIREGDRVTLGHTRLPEGYGQGWAAHTSYAVYRAAFRNPRFPTGEEDAYVIPDGVSWEEGVLDRIAAVAYHGVTLSDVKEGDVVAIIGQGLIGNLWGQIAKMRGAYVIASDIKLRRVELSMRFAAHIAIDGREKDLKRVLQQIRPTGADVVVEAIGKNEMIPGLIDLVRPRGKIVLQGWYPGDVQINFHAAHAKRATFYFPCHLEGRDVILKWLSQKKLALEELITHRFDAMDLPKAFDMIVKDEEDYMGIVIDWSGVS
ncbi:MAG: zinc-dependent alcohol dehydrogenase [bacterium]